jgi:hypothetical protein
MVIVRSVSLTISLAARFDQGAGGSHVLSDPIEVVPAYELLVGAPEGLHLRPVRALHGGPAAAGQISF